MYLQTELVTRYLSQRLGHLHIDHYEKFRLQLLKELLERAVFKKTLLLDVGINVGEVAKLYADRAACIIGLDLDKLALHAAKINLNSISPKVNLILGTAANLPFKRELFDVIVALEVVEHLSKDQQDIVLEEISRVGKEKSQIFISTPSTTSVAALEAKLILRRRNWNAWDSSHQYLYTSVEFIDKLRRFFVVSELYSYYFLPSLLVSLLPYEMQISLAKISFFVTTNLKLPLRISSLGMCIIAVALNRKRHL